MGFLLRLCWFWGDGFGSYWRFIGRSWRGIAFAVFPFEPAVFHHQIAFDVKLLRLRGKLFRGNCRKFGFHGRVLGLIGKVVPFMRVGLQIVEFLAVGITNITPVTVDSGVFSRL